MVFSKKDVLNSTLFVFFWNSPSKTMDLNCPNDSMWHLPRKKHWLYVNIGYVHQGSCICIVILAHWEEEHPRIGSKALLPSAVNILSMTGKISSIIAFYKLLSDIKVSFWEIPGIFLMVFWMWPLPPFVRLTPSVFSVKVVHILAIFYWYGICNSPVLNLQMFLY